MVKVTWNNAVIAEAEEKDIKEVEGNKYFPPDSIKEEYFKKSTKHTTCPWKGEASYYTLSLGDKTDKDAAWYYPEPKADPKAQEIKNYVAFYAGKVTID